MNSNKLLTAKVLIVGNSNTGKTSLATRFVENTFGEEYMATLGVDFYLKNIELDDGDTLKLQIWDTAGQERFKSIVQQYYRGANGAILTFCRADKASFEAIPSLIDLCRMYDIDLPVVLAETKIDSVDSTGYSVSNTDIIKLCTQKQIGFVKTSAKTGENVNVVFRLLAEQMIPRMTKSQRQGHRDLVEAYVDMRTETSRSRFDSLFCCKI